MNKIPDELMNKYGLPTFELYEEGIKTGVFENEEEPYRAFLIKTDYIPNKIIEGQVLGREVEDYTEILNYRQFARDEINRLSK